LGVCCDSEVEAVINTNSHFLFSIMNIYDLSRNFFNFSFENPEKIKPNHIAIYFFAVEHCNRLGWKQKFGLPTTMVMEAIGIKSYTTYINSLNDLVSYGFIKMIEKSKNQYSSNIVALSNFDKAHDKALDKALIKHTSKHMVKQCESTHQSIVSIDKQIYNNTNTQINKSTDAEFSNENLHPQDLEDNNQSLIAKKENTVSPGGRAKNDVDNRKLKFRDKLIPFLDEYGKDTLREFYNYWTENSKDGLKFRMEAQKFFDIKRRLATWSKSDKFKQAEPKQESKLKKNLSVLDSVLKTLNERENTQDAIQ